jgi:hypothetical protein
VSTSKGLKEKLSVLLTLKSLTVKCSVFVNLLLILYDQANLSKHIGSHYCSCGSAVIWNGAFHDSSNYGECSGIFENHLL